MRESYVNVRANVEELFRDFPDLVQGARKSSICPPDGWLSLVRSAFEKLNQLNPKPVICCVKEKFAGLRIYFDSLDESVKDDAFSIVHEAEKLAIKTCETCGNPGKPRQDSWISTLCEEHAEGRKEWIPWWIA